MTVKDLTDVVSFEDKEIIVTVINSTVALDVLVIKLLSSEFDAKPSLALLVGSASEVDRSDQWTDLK